MELIILIFIIVYVVKIAKKNTNSDSSSKGNPNPSSDPYAQIPPPPKNPAPSAQTVQRTVNQHLFGSASKPTDKYRLYKRFIEQDRYTDLAKLGHELGISKYQAVQDVKALQKEGYFKTVTVDDRSYKLIYSAPAKYASRSTSTPPSPTPAKTAAPPAKTAVPPASKPSKPAVSASARTSTAPFSGSSSSDEELELKFVQPSDPYRPDRNAGLRHEEWMQLPPHTQAVKCHYCGALNAVPIGRRTKYTCYFCREEL